MFDITQPNNLISKQNIVSNLSEACILDAPVFIQTFLANKNFIRLF